MEKPQASSVVITPPKFKTASFTIQGQSPLVIHAFSEKARNMMADIITSGTAGKNRKKRGARDFKADFEAARYREPEQGWDGINAASFRNAMISACRVAGYVMSKAKLSVFCEADGFSQDGTPLVKITKGKPMMHVGHGRNSNGSVDLRARPMWSPGWEAIVRIRFDEDQFQLQDVANLLARVGSQVGIGEGRADSKESAGCGWGFFSLKEGASESRKSA